MTKAAFYITWIDDDLYGIYICSFCFCILNTNKTCDIVSSIVVKYCFIFGCFALKLAVAETVCCWQNPMLVNKTTTTWICSIVIIYLKWNIIVIIIYFGRAGHNKPANIPGLNPINKKIIRILKISSDFLIVLLSKYSEENFQKYLQSAAPKYLVWKCSNFLKKFGGSKFSDFCPNISQGSDFCW